MHLSNYHHFNNIININLTNYDKYLNKRIGLNQEAIVELKYFINVIKFFHYIHNKDDQIFKILITANFKKKSNFNASLI